MPTITLESSERSKKKSRLRSNLRGYGSRHGDSFWTEEKERNNFGLKYMNKYGWSKGDGLGKYKQGNINHVKTKYKNDNKGIGCKHNKNDTMFQATMCMFNDILSSLNNKKKDVSFKSNTKHLSASSVIKSYEAKHHLYNKFREAKNICNRSEEDKNELFGNIDIRDNKINGFTENDQTEYAMKMNALSMMRSGKMGLGFNDNNNHEIDRNTLRFGKFKRSGFVTRDNLFYSEDHKDTKNKNEKDNVIINHNNDYKAKKEKKDKKKKKKKKNKKNKKDKKDKFENVNTDISKEEDQDIDILDIDIKEKKKKKKKKKKKRKDKEIDNGDNKIKNDDINIVVHDTLKMDSVLMDDDNDKNIIKSKKKKNKKKNKNKKRKLNEIENGESVNMEPMTKKLRLDVNVINDNMSDISSTASILSSIQTPIQSDIDNEENVKEKKSKKKKSKKKKKNKNKDKTVKKDKSKKKDKKKKKKKKNEDVIMTE